MYLPVPISSEVEAFRAVYRQECGEEIAWSDAFDALSRLAQFIYLTEYAPVRLLREVGWSVQKPLPERRRQLPPKRSTADILAWYEGLSPEDKRALHDR